MACDGRAREASAGLAGERAFYASALWDDGSAEVARYRVVERRYGTLREAEATLIVVKETLDADALVKDDGPQRAPRTIEAMKLNHVLDVPTGVYTYRQMASAFMRRADARPVRLTIGSHEWCGVTYKRLLVRDGAAVLHTSSYFGAEGDRSFDVPLDERTVLYDALPMWARTLDLSRPGARRVRLVPPQLSNRAEAPSVAPATIAVGRRATVEVPAGRLETVRVRIEHAGGTDVMELDAQEPHTMVRWQRADGGRYELRWVRRARYWEMNGPDDAGALEGAP